MKAPGMMSAVVALLGALMVQASGAELTKEEQKALGNLKQLLLRHAEYCTKENKPMPSTFAEFVSPEDVAALTKAGSGQADSKPLFQLKKPARLYTGVTNPARTVLITSSFTTEGGDRLVGFVDGHVEVLPEREAERLESAGTAGK